jgi:hypothetical protein
MLNREPLEEQPVDEAEERRIGSGRHRDRQDGDGGQRPATRKEPHGIPEVLYEAAHRVLYRLHYA